MDDGSQPESDHSDYSDAGAPAARQGFKYQDHIAVSYLLDMIADDNFKEVHCETHDDIVLVRNSADGEQFEYVQVKTTELDKKYSKTEIYERDQSRKGTSLIEKSLACDNGRGTNPLFRFVSRRDVNNSLKLFKLKREVRLERPGNEQLCRTIGNKYKTVKSDGDRNLRYWADNLFWEVAGSQEGVIAQNKVKLTRIASSEGANPPIQLVDEGYEALLGMSDVAATASKFSEPEKKKISRTTLREWWEEYLDQTETYTLKNAKPYLGKTEDFLVEFIDLEEAEIFKALSGYEARYEGDRWRTEELANHMVDWLPEIALKASELVQINPLNFRQRFADALERVADNSYRVTLGQLTSDTLLHIITRQKMGSEPTACRVFERGRDGHITFSNAHIVRKEKDELWLGKSIICEEAESSSTLSLLLEGLSTHIEDAFLRREKELLISLREPKHLRYNSLNKLIAKNAPISELLEHTRFPLLVAYNSAALSAHRTDYKDEIEREAKAIYEDIKSKMPEELDPVKITIFLVPLDDIQILTNKFSELTGLS